jgi:hypothetical protein
LLHAGCFASAIAFDQEQTTLSGMFLSLFGGIEGCFGHSSFVLGTFCCAVAYLREKVFILRILLGENEKSRFFICSLKNN